MMQAVRLACCVSAYHRLSALVAAGVTITNEQRTIHARAIRQNLARLEDEPDVIEGTARELAA